MSAAVKAVTIASSVGLVSAASLFALRTPQQDFSKMAQSLEHTAEAQSLPAIKPKLPSNYFSFTLKGYEVTNAQRA